MSQVQEAVPVRRPAELPALLARLLDEFEVYSCGSWFALRCRHCGSRIGLYQTLSLTTVVSIGLRHPARCPTWPAPELNPIEDGLDRYLYETGASDA